MNDNRYTSWIEVDLDAIRANFRHLKEASAPANTLAVVKSEAYGHGLEAVAMTVAEEGAWGLAIVSTAEGRRLRQAGITLPIILIAPILRSHIEDAISLDLRPVVFDLDFARDLSAKAVAMGRKVKVHIKADTGMGRLSMPAEKIADLALEISRLPNLEIEGIYSHLAAADGLDQSYSAIQFSRFNKCIQDIESVGLNIPFRHLAASAGLLLLDSLHKHLNLTRAGIALYGLWPSSEVRLVYASRQGNLQQLASAQVTGEDSGEGTPNAGAAITDEFIRPALTFKTVVAQVKTVKAGTSISYGCTFKCHRETTIAVLPIGYSDGYDRHLSNRGEVLIHGHRAPIMGRICMNICMVDITDIPEVREGDEVVLLGHQGKDYISADEIADNIDTINYEVVTRLPIHIPRIYLGQKPQGLEDVLRRRQQ